MQRSLYAQPLARRYSEYHLSKPVSLIDALGYSDYVRITVYPHSVDDPNGTLHALETNRMPRRSRFRGFGGGFSMAEAVVYASMDPDDFSQGGGLFDDVDAVVTKAEFTDQPPSDSYTVEGNPLFFVLGLLIDGADEPVEQSYSMGAKSGDNFTIADDDKGALVPASQHSKVSGSCKFAALMGSLKSEGFPMTKLGGPGGSMTNLLKTRAHFNRVVDAERKGLKTGGKEKKFPETTLLFSKIHSLPDEAGTATAAAPAAAAKGGRKPKAPAATATAAAPATSAPAAAAPTGNGHAADHTSVAEQTLMAILMAAEGFTVQKGRLPLLSMREIPTNPDRQDIGKLIFNDEFLSRETSWKFNKAANPQTVSLQ